MVILMSTLFLSLSVSYDHSEFSKISVVLLVRHFQAWCVGFRESASDQFPDPINLSIAKQVKQVEQVDTMAPAGIKKGMSFGTLMQVAYDHDDEGTSEISKKSIQNVMEKVSFV